MTALALLLTLFAAQAADRVEAETAGGAVVRDASASGGRALAPTRTATLPATAPAPSRLVVIARRRCAGALRLTVGVDGRARTVRVRDRRWTGLSYRPKLPTGAHRVTLDAGRCVLVDALRLDPQARWIPAPTTTWQWQLSGRLDLSVPAEMVDVDLVETPAATVAALRARGSHPVCYLSAGSYERFRPDARDFPARVLGRPLEGWPGERWLDIRRLRVLGPIMERRMDLCREKGFEGVEADNVDGYANRSGFPLTGAHQLRFNRFLARTAHRRGLSIGLKNDLDQVEALEPHFDWAINEQCFQYDECERLRPFARAGKAVFVAEYELDPDAFCARARAEGFMAMRKRLELDASREACW